jgi:methyl-accepting chemotaxis protein
MPPRYRRSIFLINKPFQFRFALYVCSFLIAMSFAYPMIIYQVFDYFVSYVARDPMAPAITTLHETRDEIVFLLVIMQLGVLLACFIMSIFMSHRIAGPLFKLRKFMSAAKTGKIGEELFFRKADHFKELATEYNEMMRGIRSIVGKNVETLSAAIAQIERAETHAADPQSKKDLADAVAALRSVRQNLPK